MMRWIVMLVLAMTGAAVTGEAEAKTEKAVFAGGCFWCVESDFESVSGVSSVVSGYTGGASANPTYDAHEGHYEAVEITFDTARISYADLVAKFLRSVDVTDDGGQFCDRGPSYRTAIFALNSGQKADAQAAVAAAEAQLGVNVVTKVLPAKTFWRAEDYHQDYYKGTNYVLTRAGPKQQKNAYAFIATLAAVMRASGRFGGTTRLLSTRADQTGRGVIHLKRAESCLVVNGFNNPTTALSWNVVGPC